MYQIRGHTVGSCYQAVVSVLGFDMHFRRVGAQNLDGTAESVRIHGLGCVVQGSGFRVPGSVFRVQGLGFRVWALGFGFQGLGFNA